MIDIHCHILPGIDDGASNVEESFEMAKQAIADGIRTVVATPHTLNGVYFNSLQDVSDQVFQLRQDFEKKELNLELCPGAEVHLCVGMTEQIRSGEAVLLNDYRVHKLETASQKRHAYVLVEFPVQVIPPGYKNELFQLKASGITPIIAHPERNMFFQRQDEILYDLVNMGCLFQITALSITGGLGSFAKASARKMLERRLVHLIASDAHSSENRSPVLSPAVEYAARIMKNMQEAEDMVTTIPEAILEGKAIYPREPIQPPKKKWFFRLFGG